MIPAPGEAPREATPRVAAPQAPASGADGTLARSTSSVPVRSDRARRQNRLRWELLEGLIRKDLKVKYQGSVLGFVWSLANPLLLLAVYSFVFGVVLKSGIPHFGFYLLAGLLVWNFFAGAVGTATQAVLGNSGLVQKVPFPLAVLPLSTIGFHVVHLVLQLAVMMVVMAATGFTGFLSAHLLWMLPALLVALVLATGVSALVAALNVKYRDTQHIVEILLMAGFWLNPIVYPWAQVHQEIKGNILDTVYWFNPMAGVTSTMQYALYSPDAPLLGRTDGAMVLPSADASFYLEKLAIGGGVALVMLVLGVYVYRRMSADFAENL